MVGCPIKKEGGVVPYNFGEAVQDLEFERTGALSSPPMVLLIALTKLSAAHERKGSYIAESPAFRLCVFDLLLSYSTTYVCVFCLNFFAVKIYVIRLHNDLDVIR